jgi:hypothetical protein
MHQGSPWINRNPSPQIGWVAKPIAGRYWVIAGYVINLAAVDWTEGWN